MKKVLLLCAISSILAACATIPYQPYAREVKKKPLEGGVIALHTEFKPEDHAKADSLMTANCGQDMTVKVAEEGEVVVGEKTNSSAKKTNDTEKKSGFSLGGLTFGSPSSVPTENTNTSSVTTQVKEWQIAYNCVAIKAAAAPEVAATAAPAHPHKKKKAIATNDAAK